MNSWQSHPHPAPEQQIPGDEQLNHFLGTDGVNPVAPMGPEQQQREQDAHTFQHLLVDAEAGICITGRYGDAQKDDITCLGAFGRWGCA